LTALSDAEIRTQRRMHNEELHFVFLAKYYSGHKIKG